MNLAYAKGWFGDTSIEAIRAMFSSSLKSEKDSGEEFFKCKIDLHKAKTDPSRPKIMLTETWNDGQINVSTPSDLEHELSFMTANVIAWPICTLELWYMASKQKFGTTFRIKKMIAYRPTTLQRGTDAFSM